MQGFIGIIATLAFQRALADTTDIGKAGYSFSLFSADPDTAEKVGIGNKFKRETRRL
jgi:hypothetical protein